MRNNRRNADHDDLMRILLIGLSGGNMESVLQLRSQTFHDHPFFLQAVHPGSPQSEDHCCDLHSLSPFADFALISAISSVSSAGGWSSLSHTISGIRISSAVSPAWPPGMVRVS